MKQPLPLEKAFNIISQVGQALYHAHNQGIAHHDLKPENILLFTEDDAVLGDFGIALTLKQGKQEYFLTARGQPIEGTLPYLAPEQFKGEVSLKSDQYALGCIVYELLTGTRPIKAEVGYNVNREAIIAIWAKAHANQQPISLRTHNTDLSKQVEAAVLKAIAKNRQDRHASVRDFLIALGLTPEPITGQLPESNFLNVAAQWIVNGDTFYRGKDYEQALQAYNSSLIFDSDNADTFLRIGNVFRQLERSSEALNAYEKGVQVAPENKRDIFYCHMGHVLCDIKMYEDAFRAYNEAIRQSPEKAIFHVYKGDALRAFRDFKGAFYAYEEAIKWSTSGIIGAKAYAGIGEAFMGLRRCPEAIKAYEEAIKQHPTNALLYLAKGLEVS